MNKQLNISILLSLFSNSLWADVSVIVHPSNQVEMTQKEITRLFLGKSKSFPGGAEALPINQPESTKTTKDFNATVLKKSDRQLKAYWSKLLFTGKGTPPKILENDSEMIKFIIDNPSYIGYVDSNSVTDAIKVLSKAN